MSRFCPIVRQPGFLPTWIVSGDGGEGDVPAGTSSCLLVSGNWKPSSFVVNVTLTWAISGSKAVAPTIFESMFVVRETGATKIISRSRIVKNKRLKWQLGNFCSLATPALPGSLAHTQP
jgi:hypothetical protein